MNLLRRDALKWLSGTLGAIIVAAFFAEAQSAKQAPVTASGEETPDPKLDPKRTKTILEQNQKDLKKDIEKLFQLATDLKDEVEKTDSINTLSLQLLKKTEEIERLARQIREKAKG
jgi:hypothetical protein